MANAADNYQFNSGNVFDSWDLNPLAQKIGGGADGVRDTLAQNRDAFLQPYYQQYRSKVGVGNGNAAADDQSLFNDSNFQNFVRTGQTPTSTSQTAPTTGLPGQMMNQQASQATTNDARNNDLYNLLMQRATQGLNVSPSDPIIAGQTDAYRAQQERQRQQYLAQTAEQRGPYANLQNEARMTSESVGQNTGNFQAQLMSNELTARRQEIAQALSGATGLLTSDQQNELQRQMALLDNAIAQQQVGNQATSIGNQYDLGLRNIGLNEWDRNMYYDALNRGLLG